MSSRHLEDMGSRLLHDMSSRRLQDMSSRRLKDMSSRRLQDVFTTNKCLLVKAHINMLNMFKVNKNQRFIQDPVKGLSTVKCFL